MLMNIFSTIAHGFYSPEFYGKPERFLLPGAFAYFFKFALIIALAVSIALSVIAGPTLVRALSADNIGSLAAYYPADLTVTIKGGKASTNVKEPYFIPMPADMAPASYDSAYKNLVAIDTATTSPIEAYRAYDAVILLTKDYLVSEKQKGQITVQQVKAFPDISINRGLIKDVIAKFVPYLKALFPILFLLAFIAIFVGLSISNLFFLLIMSLITWAASAAFKSGLAYGKCFSLGLYALTGPIIISLLLQIVGVHTLYFDIPVFLLFFFLNAKKYYVMVKAA